jgi:hypothetical protein
MRHSAHSIKRPMRAPDKSPCLRVSPAGVSNPRGNNLLAVESQDDAFEPVARPCDESFGGSVAPSPARVEKDRDSVVGDDKAGWEPRVLLLAEEPLDVLEVVCPVGFWERVRRSGLQS